VSPSDYDPYCVTAPVDSRLPGGGGQQICGLNDLKLTKVGQVQTVRTTSETYGDQIERWQGLDLTLQARLPNHAIVQGGFSGGSLLTDECDIVTKVDNPSTFNCRQESAFLTQIKLLGSYPLPWGLQVSGTFQSLVPAPVGGANFNYNYFGLPANYVASSAQVAPSLGRALSSGGNVTVNVITPGTFYPERTNQFDLRLSRTLNLGQTRLQGLLDLFNVFNSNAVQRQNGSYGTNGATWAAPQAIIPGRLLKFGVQFRF
jgi:hypothetical protein